MAIRAPGRRGRGGRRMGGARRNVVFSLSLTAMVDMFTVLVVFLLQNYKTTGQAIDIPKEVTLPQAGTVKEIKPSNVVVITSQKIYLNSDHVENSLQVRESKDWVLPRLYNGTQKLIAEGEAEKKRWGSQLKQSVLELQDKLNEEAIDEFKKITLQADKSIDFLTLKKIMYTLTEAGIIEINFAVLKDENRTKKL